MEGAFCDGRANAEAEKLARSLMPGGTQQHKIK